VIYVVRLPGETTPSEAMAELVHKEARPVIPNPTCHARVYLYQIIRTVLCNIVYHNCA